MLLIVQNRDYAHMLNNIQSSPVFKCDHNTYKCNHSSRFVYTVQMIYFYFTEPIAVIFQQFYKF